jgi:hypothetical protein
VRDDSNKIARLLTNAAGREEHKTHTFGENAIDLEVQNAVSKLQIANHPLEFSAAPCRIASFHRQDRRTWSSCHRNSKIDLHQFRSCGLCHTPRSYLITNKESRFLEYACLAQSSQSRKVPSDAVVFFQTFLSLLGVSNTWLSHQCLSSRLMCSLFKGNLSHWQRGCRYSHEL